VAAVTSGLDARDLLHFLGVGEGEVEVLDLVPVVGEALRHHRLVVLAGDQGVALGAHLVGLEIIIGPGAEGGIARRPGGVSNDQGQSYDSHHSQETHLHGILLASPRYA